MRVIISMTKLNLKILILIIFSYNEKSNKNILIYDISYKTLIGAKPLRIRFDKINGFIRVDDGIRY